MTVKRKKRLLQLQKTQEITRGFLDKLTERVKDFLDNAE